MPVPCKLWNVCVDLLNELVNLQNFGQKYLFGTDSVNLDTGGVVGTRECLVAPSSSSLHGKLVVCASIHLLI